MKLEFVDETEFSKERESLFAIQGGTIKKAMESRRINTHLFVDVDSAKAYIEEFISKRDYIRDIAFSDGVTLYQMGLFDWILDKYSGGGVHNKPTLGTLKNRSLRDFWRTISR